MGLDVDLKSPEEIECPDCKKECWTCNDTGKIREIVFSSNITHNLNKMANDADIYLHLWRPEELGITKAKELIKPLEKGLKLLKSDPERFKKFNALNGWGLYEHFVPWVEDYLNACKENPDTLVVAYR